MNIQNTKESLFLNQTVFNFNSKQKEHLSNPLTQAIKDYKDEYLTGLTDDEREQIRKEIKAYLDSIPKGQKADPNKLKDLVADLLKQYGFKGDIDDMGQTLIGDVEKELQEESASSQDAAIAYNKLTAAGTTRALTPNQPLLSEASTEETTSQIITNADGSKSLVITKNDVILSTIRLTSESDASAYFASPDLKENESFDASTHAFIAHS